MRRNQGGSHNDCVPLVDTERSQSAISPKNDDFPAVNVNSDSGWRTVFTSEQNRDTLPDAVEMQEFDDVNLCERGSRGQGQQSSQQFDTDFRVNASTHKHGYSWAWLCAPRLPCSKPSPPPPFFYLHSPIPWSLAAVMGLQHALAMMGGIVTSPILISGPDYLRLSDDDVLYLISAGLIMSGLTSFVQIRQVRWRGLSLGTGLVSVMGTSFTFIPIVQVSAAFLMQEESSRRCGWDGDCSDAWAGTAGEWRGVSRAGFTNAGQCSARGFCRHSGREAYGAFLGTALVGSLLEMLLSRLPARALRRLFPPIVTGVCVLLIGVGLTGTGFKYWGGGAACAEAADRRKMEYHGPDLAGNVTGARYPSESPCRAGACAPPDGKFVGVCAYAGPRFDAETNVTRGDVTVCEAFASPPGVEPHVTSAAASWLLCGSNGEVTLPFGSPPYIALGASVFFFLLVVEVVGSPFMRNCNLVLALAAGTLIAALWPYTAQDGSVQRFVVTEDLDETPWFIFLWFRRFPLALYPPLVPPMLVCFVITAVETVGDITAAAEASRVPTGGDQLAQRIQGGLLADAINTVMACLVYSMPNTTISQNSAVIVLTRCANRRAGYCCCLWLILFGVLAPTAAVISAIPKAVVGGMTTFLFVNVAISGISILAMDTMDRRRRFILSGALGMGLGVALVPAWARNALWPASESEGRLAGLLRDSALITLSTPYCVGTLVALVLNAVLPEDAAEEPEPDLDTIPQEEEAAAGEKAEDSGGLRGRFARDEGGSDGETSTVAVC